MTWLLAALCSAGQVAPDTAIINQALDQPVTLTLDDLPVPIACQQVSAATGVGVSIAPDTMSLLPYGEATRVTVRFRQTPLRDGLRALCDQIGMEYFLTESGVEIVPSPALIRLGRPASWEELQTLSRLMRTHWRGDDDDEFDDIRKLVRFDGVSGDAEDERKRLARAVEKAGAGSAAEVLTRACASLGNTWIPYADEIIIMSEAQLVRYQMQRLVSLRFQNAPLAAVLLDLSRQSGVPIRLEPASAAQLPDRVKNNVSLLAEGVTVEEALEQLAVAAGLAYAVEKDGIVLSLPPGVVATDSGNRQRDPIVGKVIMTSPDGRHTYEWFIRESDLTPEELARLEELKRSGINALRRDLAVPVTP